MRSASLQIEERQIVDESTGEESFRHMVIMDLVFDDLF